jgi:hypothetical protein
VAPKKCGAGDRRVIALFLETRTRLGEDKPGGTSIIPQAKYAKVALRDIKTSAPAASLD